VTGVFTVSCDTSLFLRLHQSIVASSDVLGQFAINAWEVVSPKTLMETGKLNMDKGVDMPAEDGRFKSASILK
jgi:hypothetical protein